MSDHVVPRRVYYAVFTTLMVLTAVTVWVAFADLGMLNMVAAMTIACVKATLVVAYFMHVRYGSHLIKVVLGAAVLWLLILLVLTLGDYATRGWLPFPGK